VYCSVQASYAVQVSGNRYYAVRDVSRRDRFGFLVVAAQLLMLFFKERPRVLVTTGAAPGLIAIVIAKAFGTRTLWIDSLANCERLSSSGKMAARLADKCVSQWPEVARGNALEYWGSVL